MKTEQEYHDLLQHQLATPIICRWSKDKVAAFSVTIDDNFAGDHKQWCDWADKFGWKWTWFVITGHVATGDSRGGEWEDWQRLKEKGHDIQSHTVTHLDPKASKIPISEDYKQSKRMLNKHVKKQSARTLSYPYGFSEKKHNMCADIYSPGCTNSETEAKKSYLAARGVVGQLSPLESIDFENVNSFSLCSSFFNNKPFSQKTECKAYQKFDSVLDVKNRNHFLGTWYCVHSHSLYPTSKDDHKVANGVLEMLHYVKSKEADVWVGTFTQIAQYAQERKAAKVLGFHHNFTDTTDNINFKVVLDKSLTVGSKENWFDFPLTIKVDLGKIHKADRKVTAYSHEDKTKSLAVTIVSDCGNQYALVDVVPNGKWVTVSVLKRVV